MICATIRRDVTIKSMKKDNLLPEKMTDGEASHFTQNT